MDNLDAIRSALATGRVKWRRHALERLLERGISRTDVFTTIRTGEVIETDANRQPFPTYLWFATIGERPIHVAIAWDQNKQTVYMLTAYEPDEIHFHRDFKTRR